MRIKSIKLNQVKIVAKDTLEGILLAIISKKIFKERLDLELVTEIRGIEDKILKDKDYLEPVKSLLVAGLEIRDKSRIEYICNQRGIKFRQFENKESKQFGTNYIEGFIESFSNYPKIKEEIEGLRELIEIVLSNRNIEKKKELIKLINILGGRRFVERFEEDSSLEFSEDEQSLVLLESERVERELGKLIESSIDFELAGLKSRLIFNNISIYSDYYLEEILRRDRNIELAMILDLPKEIKIKFKKVENLEFQRELITKLRGRVNIFKKIVESKVTSFGIKKMVFEFLKFYKESRVKF